MAKKTVRIVEKKGKGPKGHVVTTTVTSGRPRKGKKHNPPVRTIRRRDLGKSRGKHELGLSVSTPSNKDYDYTLIQSGADTRPFDASFDIAELSIAPVGSIVFSQSISAVAAAIMQQESNKDAAGNSTVSQTLVSGILNYMEYRFTKVQLRLLGRVPDEVSGELGVMFVPPGIKVTAENFVDLFDARAGSKPFPGCRRISLKDLNPSVHKGKWLTIDAEYRKGGRPIGLSEVTQDGVVGKIVIGMLSNALSSANTVYVANSSNPGPSSSSDQTIAPARVVGDLCLLNMHVEGHWIFTAPGQVPIDGAISALQIVVNESFDPLRAFQGNTSGDNSYVGGVVGGLTPPVVAEAVMNSIAQEKLRGGYIGPNTGMIGSPQTAYIFMTDGSGTIGNFFTASTIKSLANTVVEGVAEFFPPLVRQLVVWGGRTMIGVIDRLVNTQDGMLSKEQNMTAENHISTNTGAWPGNPNLGTALTPSQTHFTPGNNPDTSIPFSPAIQLMYNRMAEAPVGSVWRNLAFMIQRCLTLGIYPFFSTSTINALATVHTSVYQNQDIVELFLRDVGGIATWMPTLTMPASSAPDDFYSGIPLFMGSSREGSVQPGYVRSDNSLALGSAYQSRMGPTQIMLKRHAATPAPTGKHSAALVPAFLEIDFFSKILAPSAGWTDGSLNGMIATLIGDGADVFTMANAIASFMGHEVSIRDGRYIVITHKFTYAARASLNDDQWDPAHPLPLTVNDSGYCTIISEVDSEAPVTVMYLGSVMNEHCASYLGSDGLYHTRNISHDVSQWEDGDGALFFIEPSRCYSV